MEEVERLTNDLAQLEVKMAEVEERKRDAEENMMRAAQFGKDLLDKNQEITGKLDIFEQEKYELQMMLQSKLQVEKSLSTELEIARDNVKMMEEEKEQNSFQVNEMLGKKEEFWRMRISELESNMKCMEAKEIGLKNRLDISEKQLEEANMMLNQSVAGMSFSEEMGDLQGENLALIQKNQMLETEIGRINAELEEERVVSKGAQIKIEMTQQELEAVQCQITGYVRAVETSREEVMELEAQMEAMRAGQMEVDGKGNSLFSEVEDRRCIVESQMANLQMKYDAMKSTYDGKVSQLSKVKMHNSQLLSIAGTRGDNGHAARLEELLAAEREKNKALADRLDVLEVINPVKMDVIRVAKGEEGGLDDSEGIQQHTASEEYCYLTSLLDQTQKKNEELQKQMHQQLRQNLKDSDKIRDMSRKVHATEIQMTKMKTDNYMLKMQLEQAKIKDGKQETKKETKKIVEMIKFDKKENLIESVKGDKKQFLLKETLIKGSKVPESRLKKENKENIDTDENTQQTVRNSKKSTCFKETVEEIDTEGQTESGQLQDEDKEKLKPAKPLGKKRFGSQNTVQCSDQPTECKQQ